MAKRRVGGPGRAGYVAQRMFPELHERWDLVPIDVRPATRDGREVPGLVVADLTRPDRNEYPPPSPGAARPPPPAGREVPGLGVAALPRPDRNEYRRHFRGADAVIHCGFVSAANLDATPWQDNSDAKFWAEHTNVALCYNVCRVALEEDGRRVVVGSSNHAP